MNMDALSRSAEPLTMEPPPRPPAPIESHTIESLTIETHTIETHISEPPHTEPPPPAAETRELPAPEPEPVKPMSKSVFDSLEEEMASLLGRPEKP